MLNHRLYRRVQALILVLTGIFLLWKVFSGNLFYYINDRYTWLLVAAALGLIGLATALFPRREEATPRPNQHYANYDPDRAQPNWWAIALVALPVVLGTLLPARPLGTNALDNKELNMVSAGTAANASASTFQVQLAPEDRTILDWVVLFTYGDDPTQYEGQPAVVDGFVFNDARLTDGQFMVGRFTLACCAADSSAVALVVDASALDLTALDNDTWVEITGPITLGTLDGQTIPVIRAQTVNVTTAPDNPYLYP